MTKLLLLIATMILFFSCIRENQHNDTITKESLTKEDRIKDEIHTIDKNLNNIDISELKGLAIHYRSVGLEPNTLGYFVSNVDINCSPFIVIYNTSLKRIVKIDNSLVIKFGCNDYLADTTITKAFYKYLKLDVCVLKIDSVGNIYINKNNQDIPDMLKIYNKSNLPNDINEFFKFEGNWYVRK